MVSDVENAVEPILAHWKGEGVSDFEDAETYIDNRNEECYYIDVQLVSLRYPGLTYFFPVLDTGDGNLFVHCRETGKAVELEWSFPFNEPRLKTSLIYSELEDNGQDGVGTTLRGNSNSNLINGGRAVKASDGTVYYVETTELGEMQSVDTLYKRVNGEDTALLSVENNRITALNLNEEYHFLYFLAPDDGVYNSESDANIYILYTQDDEVQHILTEEKADGLLCLYDWVLVSGHDADEGYYTKVYRRITHDHLYTIKDFFAYAAMDGWLYGYTADPEAPSMRINMLNCIEEPLPISGIPFNGNLYSFDETGTLSILNTGNGSIKDVSYDGENDWTDCFAVCDDTLFIKDTDGNIYRCDLEGKLIETETDAQTQYGISLLDNELAIHAVPCD